MEIATRVWNHKWKIDPIVRSLIDTDFYKLLMCQSVFHNRPDVQVTFSLINRSHHVPLAKLIDEGELREQLDHIRSLSLTRGESTWLRGNTFYGKRQMFRPDFMEWFENLRLPPYFLERVGDQYELTFEGSWPEVMLWEIPALAVLMELRSRAVLDDMKKFELQVLYARATAKLWEKIERLRDQPGLKIADFGTRRRHSFLWQDWCVQAMSEGLGDRFTGTSNCLIAKNRDLEAIGTNAHELPMVAAALAETAVQFAGEAPQDVNASTADGLDLAGYYWPAKAGNDTLVVYFHGNGYNQLVGAARAEPLRKGGHGVLVASYRGYGDNPGVPSEEGLFADAEAWMAEARELAPGADVYLFGHSLGVALKLFEFPVITASYWACVTSYLPK